MKKVANRDAGQLKSPTSFGVATLNPKKYKELCITLINIKEFAENVNSNIRVFLKILQFPLFFYPLWTVS